MGLSGFVIERFASSECDEARGIDVKEIAGVGSEVVGNGCAVVSITALCFDTNCIATSGIFSNGVIGWIVVGYL